MTVYLQQQPTKAGCGEIYVFLKLINIKKIVKEEETKQAKKGHENSHSFFEKKIEDIASHIEIFVDSALRNTQKKIDAPNHLKHKEQPKCERELMREEYQMQEAMYQTVGIPENKEEYLPKFVHKKQEKR
jgi:hypothetical protein